MSEDYQSIRAVGNRQYPFEFDVIDRDIDDILGHLGHTRFETRRGYYPHGDSNVLRTVTEFRPLWHAVSYTHMADADQFTDRTEAGRRLGEALRDREFDVDIVLAIARGGLPLGRVVADMLEVPLDIVVASKIGSPENPELAIGAVASDGTVWRNQETFERTGADESYFEQERKNETETARQKAKRYRGEPSLPDLTGKTVVVVDDGVATGSTVRASVQMLKTTEAAHVVLAVPVGPPDTIKELQELADEVLCLKTPSSFMGVGQFYQRFEQVSDEEATAYLEPSS